MTVENRLRVWDAPTRLVHWLIVASVSFAWWAAETHRMDWHRYAGYTLLGLLTFRLYWGLAGSTTSRFAHFVRSPGMVWRYLRDGATKVWIGHNPIGGWSALALLATLIAQVTLGLFTVDVDGIESGPLSHLVSFDVGRECAKWHHKVFDVLLALIVLHLAAIAFYGLVKRNNLVAPMITGWKKVKDLPVDTLKFASWWNALVGIAVASGVVWWLTQ